MHPSSIKPWTKEETEFLRVNYPIRGREYCIEKLKRFPKTVGRKIKELGLKLDRSGKFWKDFQGRAAQTKIGRKRPAQATVLNKLRAEGRLVLTENGRNKLSRLAKERRLSTLAQEVCRGWGTPNTKGLHLSENQKNAMREGWRKAWANMNHKLNSREYRQFLSDHMYNRHRAGTAPKARKSRCNGGKRDDIGIYVRSSWEANIARYLNFLVVHKKIVRWEYESETFQFDKIKRGCRSYTPDFKVWERDGSVYFIEVKGWMDQKSKTKLARMKRYYPTVKIDLIDQDRYKAISRSKGLIQGWE